MIDGRPPKGQRLSYVGGYGAPHSKRWSRFHRGTSHQAGIIRAAFGHEDTEYFALGDRRIIRYLGRTAPTGLAPTVAASAESVMPPADRMVGRGHPCQYCTEPADCVDHVWPKSRGGDDHPNNLVRSCTPCNLAKGNKSLFGTRCPGCGETRHPSDLDTATQVAFYACRCGSPWSVLLNLQHARTA